MWWTPNGNKMHSNEFYFSQFVCSRSVRCMRSGLTTANVISRLSAANFECPATSTSPPSTRCLNSFVYANESNKFFNVSTFEYMVIRITACVCCSLGANEQSYPKKWKGQIPSVIPNMFRSITWNTVYYSDRCWTENVTERVAIVEMTDTSGICSMRWNGLVASTQLN